MATSHGFPKWLISCKDEVTQSKEWNSFVHELHEAIQQQLTESHVQYFSDLSEPEKELFMQRATRALDGGTSSRTLFSKISSSMDVHLNDQVGKQLMDDYPTDTRTDLVVESAEEGVMSLLKRWPDMKSKLHVCFNQPLQEPIRQLAWKLFFSNPKVRKTYVDILNANPRAAISPQDLDISQKVEQMVLAEPTFTDLKGSIGAFYAIKATLSYHHAKQQTNNRLKDIDYFLAVPFVLVAESSLSRREPASGKVVALLVEEYFTFLQTRPGFVVDSGSEIHNEEIRGFVGKVAVILEARYPEMASLVSRNFVPAREKIVATEKGSRALLVEGLMELVRPIIRTMFVGYLKFDTLLYVWDQYVLGLDVPGFSAEWLSVAVATLLGLENDKLQKCQSPLAMEEVINRESPFLTVEQFQYEVKKYHHKDLYNLLTSDHKSAIPVLDPTQAIHPAWRHWHNDQIPPYTKPTDRRKAREEREAERERLLQQQRDAERKRREGASRERKNRMDDMTKGAALEQARTDKEKNDLEDELMEERRRRLDGERKAQEEIEQLRRELDALKKPPPVPYLGDLSPRPRDKVRDWYNRMEGYETGGRSPSVFSRASFISRVLIPPPPTPASHVSGPLPTIPQSPPQTPARSLDPRVQAEGVILDFLKRIRKSMDVICHGEGQEAETLDKETQKYIHNNVQDLKRAQMEVFGHALQPGEFERMDAMRQKKSSDQMMALIQKWREDRHARELRQGR